MTDKPETAGRVVPGDAAHELNVMTTAPLALRLAPVAGLNNGAGRLLRARRFRGISTDGARHRR